MGRNPSRLVDDPSVSTNSPVVRGTSVTAWHVVQLVVMGWSWSDILVSNHELCEDDIRACIEHAIAAGWVRGTAEDDTDGM